MIIGTNRNAQMLPDFKASCERIVCSLSNLKIYNNLRKEGSFRYQRVRSVSG